MANRLTEAPAQSDRISMRVEPEYKARMEIAAEARDGGNVSRLIRRAVDRLIEEEQLLEHASQSERGVA